MTASPWGYQETVVCPCGVTFKMLRGRKSPSPSEPARYCPSCRYKNQRAKMTKGWVKLGKNKCLPPKDEK